VWVIFWWLVADALELAATNTHNWHPDFILKLWITLPPTLAPALGLGILLALQHRDRPDFLKIAYEPGIRGQAVVHEQPNPT